MKRENFIITVLETVSPDHTGDLWWRCDGEYAPITFMVNCNDVFAWGCSDCEQITMENLPLLIASYAHSKHHGAELFCARVRGERPQGAWYSYCPPDEWPLFNACGPEREVGAGNPFKPGSYQSGPHAIKQGEDHGKES